MEIFDEKLALEKVDGNRDLMLELLGMMISELPKNLAELESAFQNGNTEERWNIAHKMTGSTAYCGVPALQTSTRALEQSIKNSRDDIAEQLARVKKDIADIIQYHQENIL